MFLASCVIPAIWSFAMMKKKDLKMSSRKISEILTMATLTTDFRKSGAVLSAIIFIWSAADRSVFMTWQTITKKSEDWNFDSGSSQKSVNGKLLSLKSAGVRI